MKLQMENLFLWRIDLNMMRNLKDKDKTQAALIDAVKAELGR